MTRFFLLGGLLAAAPLLAQAQAPDTTARRYELGLTASPQLDHFFTGNRALPVGLLYRRPLGPAKALRLRLVGRYSRRDTVDYPQQRPGNFIGLDKGSNAQRWGMGAFAGYEWQRPLAKRLRGYYGVEAGVDWRVEKMRSVYYSYNQTGYLFQDGTYTTRRIQAQLRGFVGLHWQLAPRLGVFIESAASAAYEWHTYKLRVKGTQWYNNMPDYTSPAGGFADFRGRNLALQWRPVQFVGVAVRF
ncbi:hypothetical protein [Hymenobacter sp. CRA2]|uniref:hypothetical protein n=1 Tax=Hymenobacter sp. CRA2 TaxID=1955620 RepID=UPI0009902BB4|nr:hypothetical protein [Hymenobacter sp. CRA2]OON67743.1 hypothetical protein B0919_16205 [Hymenobacter sp. CRA2]